MKNLFDFSGADAKDEKKESKKKVVVTIDIGSEAMSDPLFKKV